MCGDEEVIACCITQRCCVVKRDLGRWRIVDVFRYHRNRIPFGIVRSEAFNHFRLVMRGGVGYAATGLGDHWHFGAFSIYSGCR